MEAASVCQDKSVRGRRVVGIVGLVAATLVVAVVVNVQQPNILVGKQVKLQSFHVPTPADASREELIYMAKLTEQTERFEDMVGYMKGVVMKYDEDLTVEERNLLSVAYKNSIGSRRTSWRAISSIESKEESKASKHLALVKDYKKKIEGELTAFCDDIIQLLTDKLIARASTPEAKVFFFEDEGGLP
jgi:hypothetical protein